MDKGAQVKLQASSIVLTLGSVTLHPVMKNASRSIRPMAEPSLHEMLTDPIVQDVMRRDGVTREQILHLFEQLSAQRRRRAA